MVYVDAHGLIHTGHIFWAYFHAAHEARVLRRPKSYKTSACLSACLAVGSVDASHLNLLVVHQDVHPQCSDDHCPSHLTNALVLYCYYDAAALVQHSNHYYHHQWLSLSLDQPHMQQIVTACC